VGGATLSCAILYNVIQLIKVEHMHKRTLLLPSFLPSIVENDQSVCHSTLKKIKIKILKNLMQYKIDKQINKQKAANSTLFNSNTLTIF
jgi:hypothetical protein